MSNHEWGVSWDRPGDYLEGRPIQVLDVRQDVEWEAGRVPGSLHLGRGTGVAGPVLPPAALKPRPGAVVTWNGVSVTPGSRGVG